jgi:hypothetical protein
MAQRGKEVSRLALHFKIHGMINIPAPAMFYIRSTKNNSYVDRTKQYFIPVL